MGGPVFNDVLDKLSVFQDNNDIAFIYAVRQTGEDEFVFTVDPDPVNPGAFGDPVLVTEALRQAGRGIACVDNAPAQDQWGYYYSAFSPVFNAEGQVAGIVGVDFDSSWYNEQIRKNSLSIGVLSLLFVVTGGAVVLMITNKLRQRFNGLSEDLGVLSSEMDELMELISFPSGHTEEEEKTESGLENSDQRVTDELEELGEKIQSMQEEMRRYLAYVHNQAYTDALTRVGNTTAYMELRQQLEECITERETAFGIAVFDINLLKLVNDRFGHTAGDRIIQGAARAISDVFGVERTYRIGGDEFVALADQVTEEELERRLEQVEERIRGFNRQQEEQGTLSMSKGAALFRPGRDSSFQEVFVRADDAMYAQKDAFHRQLKDYNRYPRLSEDGA